MNCVAVSLNNIQHLFLESLDISSDTFQSTSEISIHANLMAAISSQHEKTL